MDIEQLKLVIEMIGTIKDGAVTAFLVVIGFWVIELVLFYGVFFALVLASYKVLLKLFSYEKDYEMFKKTSLSSWTNISKEEAEKLMREISNQYGDGDGRLLVNHVYKARKDLEKVWEKEPREN